VCEARLLAKVLFDIADCPRNAREVAAIYEPVIGGCHGGHDREAPAYGSTRILREAASGIPDGVRFASRSSLASAGPQLRARLRPPPFRYTSPPMQKQAWTWTTDRFPQPARMARWGHFGIPVLIFPTG